MVGNAVSLSQTLTFFSVLFWAVVLGPIGAILAVPLTLLVRAVLVDSDPRARVWRAAIGDLGERGIDLGQDAGPALEQVEAQLVAADARVVAQHVIGERGELAEKLDTHESAADDHDRETAPAGSRGSRRVRPFEALDQMVSQHERVGHRLEGHRRGGAGDKGLVGRGTQSDDEVRHYLEELRALRERRQPYALIIDANDSRGFSANQRKLQAEYIESGLALSRLYLKAFAFVSASAVQRGMMTAIFWLRKPEWPHGFFATFEEAKEWAHSLVHSAR